MDIRQMTPDDLGTVLGWAREEGWNPGLADAPAFLAADPGGFLIGEIGGEPVAAISVVRHAPGLAFLGLYIVRPEWRGKGHGLQIWQAGLARVGSITVGLDGVVAQQEAYRRSGFVLSHRHIRFEGAVGSTAPGAEIVPVGTQCLPDLSRLDAAVTGYTRPAFLLAWLAASPDRRSLALLRDGRVAGYGVIRRCDQGAKIGPLFAPDAAGAEALARALAGLMEGPVQLDVPEPNAGSTGLAARLGMAPVFETARMWKGRPPSEDLSRVFGVASFELG